MMKISHRKNYYQKDNHQDSGCHKNHCLNNHLDNEFHKNHHLNDYHMKKNLITRINPSLGGINFAPFLMPVAVIFFFIALYLGLASGELSKGTTAFLIGGIFLFAFWLVVNYNILRVKIARRSSKYGLNALILSGILLGLVGVANLLASRSQWQADLTIDKINSLSHQSLRILERMDKSVEIIAFYQDNNNKRQQVKELLELYAYHQPLIKLSFVDPDRNPKKTREYGVADYGTILFICGETRKEVTGIMEEDFTNALIHVTRKESKKLYFLTGHGEKDIEDGDRLGYTIAKDELLGLKYKVEPLVAVSGDKIPEDCSVLVIAGPESPLLEPENTMILDYLRKGGRLLAMADPGAADLSQILNPFGISFRNDMVVDPMSTLMGSDLTVPVINEYNNHDITRPFGGRFLSYFPLTRSIALNPENQERANLAWLARTRPTAWGETDFSGDSDIDFDPEQDFAGPLYLVAVATREKSDDSEAFEEENILEILERHSRESQQTETGKEDEGLENGDEQRGSLSEGEGSGDSEKKAQDRRLAEENAEKNGVFRIVAFGDSDFAANLAFKAAPGNGQFFLNAINWLASEEDLITIPSKNISERRMSMTMEESRKVLVQVIFLYPLTFFLVGIWAWHRRK